MAISYQKTGNKPRLVEATSKHRRNTLKDQPDRRGIPNQLGNLQKLAAMGQLAGGIVHDFQNLLTGIMWLGETSKSDLPESSPVRDRIQRMIELASCGGGLSRQLLSILRDSKTQETIFHAHSIIDHIAQIARHTFDPRINIHMNLAAPIDTIRANPDLMLTALLNLALNARDAMAEGGDLSFETRNATVPLVPEKELDSGHGPHFEIAVTDTGAGMKPETKAHLFKPFFTTKKGGTGLGLMSVHAFVRNAGGQIRVESGLGRGSVFRLSLPLWSGQPQCEKYPDPGIS